MVNLTPKNVFLVKSNFISTFIKKHEWIIKIKKYKYDISKLQVYQSKFKKKSFLNTKQISISSFVFTLKIPDGM